MRFFFILTLVLPTLHLNAQSISGKILDLSGTPIVGATVLVQNLGVGAAADEDGYFQLDGLKSDSYKLRISAIGFIAQTLTVQLTQTQQNLLNITLQNDTQMLGEVVITGKSKATEVREQAYAVEVIESKGFKNLSTNANDILGRISGVNLRQSGGVGSAFNLSLNGLSGNQVRIFLDGVPMDYFGTSLSLNNFSANLINRIEVYKGVVPIHLSSDALGGAINVITSGTLSSYIDASYTVGSFGTQLSSLNAQYRHENSGFTARLKSFYNRSDNNYKVPVQLVDFQTGKAADEATWVERFNDGYESRMAWAEVGFTGTKFADQLMAGVIYSDNYKELQQAANAIGQANIPYGEVSEEEDKILVNFAYNKQGLFTDKLSVNSYFVGVFSETLRKDTASVRYDWFGNRFIKIDDTTGEIENRKTLLTLDTKNYLANVNSEYQLAKNQSVTLNYSLNYLTLEGHDPFKGQNATQFGYPSDVTKQVLAASYTRTVFADRLKTTLFTKYYDYGVSAVETNYNGDDLIPFENDKSNLGFGLSATYQIKKWQFKASYENATRFPEIVELFGDGLNVEPSPTIAPEQSDNYNLGAIFNTQTPYHSLMLSFNTFVRSAEDFIIPQIRGIKAYHINYGKVLSRGADFSAGYTYKNKWVLSFNGTYLDLRDNNRWRNDQVGLENNAYRVRLPNEPYLFGNLSLSYRNEHLLSGHDHYSLSLSQNYVHKFFYRWPHLASQEKNEVPTQSATNLEMVYSLKEGRYNASFSVLNLWDAKIYDNFSQLRPGRNFNVKLRYFLN
ncbi:MAG: carboxypeptidase-like regulatory domain-containing protein [Fulvivirga sp.]